MSLKLEFPETTNFLTRDQVDEFIETVPKLNCYEKSSHARKPLPIPGLKLYTEIIYDGALRATEALNIKLKDVDIDYLELKLPLTKSGWRWCKCTTLEKRMGSNRNFLVSCDKSCRVCKGTGKKRIPQFTTLSPRVMKLISNYRDEVNIKGENYLFKSPSYPKQPIDYSWIYRRFVELGKLCNLKIFARYEIRRTKNIYTHIFRKSKAKQMDLDRFPIGVISAKLRHADITITTEYLKADLQDLKKVEGDLYGWWKNDS